MLHADPTASKNPVPLRTAILPAALLIAFGLLVGACSDDSQGSQDAQVDATVYQDAAPRVDADLSMFKHPAEVLRIIDGDTIVVLYHDISQKIRLKGVNCPELHPDPPEPCAQDAEEATRYYTPPLTYIGLEFDDEQCAQPNPPTECTGTYDRLLAYIKTAKGADLGATLISSGLAEVYEPATFARKSQYEALQTKAKDEGLCMWAN
ncbi:MAG: thermonuclease family protein [Deltaproteobacteria bacterium]|nr:thermonuclease family protein [Deltaproteobacteria bacterium]